MMYKHFLDCIADRRCLFCQRNNLDRGIGFLCSDCMELFRNVDREVCPLCKHPLENGSCVSCSKLDSIFFDSYDFIQFYTGYLKNIVQMWKREENFLINILYFKLLIQREMLDKEIPITVVPDGVLSGVKKGRAGLNYLLKMLKKSGYNTINIYKKRFAPLSKKQKNKTVVQRRVEIKDIYYLPNELKGKYTGDIYLIDDIYTTGSTLNRGAQLLKEAGFKKVHTITFFRAIMGDIY